jgi:hypothetical protein
MWKPATGFWASLFEGCLLVKEIGSAGTIGTLSWRLMWLNLLPTVLVLGRSRNPLLYIVWIAMVKYSAICFYWIYYGIWGSKSLLSDEQESKRGRKDGHLVRQAKQAGMQDGPDKSRIDSIYTSEGISRLWLYTATKTTSSLEALLLLTSLVNQSIDWSYWKGESWTVPSLIKANTHLKTSNNSICLFWPTHPPGELMI